MLIESDTRLRPPGTQLPPNEVCEALAHRLRRETEGEVLFDAASRGRYATDASIYQIMPAGVLVPKTERDIETAIAIARELRVPVLPRGAGTSQCGQTTGAALVIDHTRHFRRVIDIDTDARTAVVQPGLVLDHLNAQLKSHGLWFPVDVSTSAQATLGGMAGNNSCGSRSIAYGNMVHNVLGASVWLSDGARVDFGPVATLGGRARAIADFVRGLAATHRAEIEARWPKVMRRVGGYNLDIFHNQSERPYTADGSVNLAHLLIGSEGTLACTRTLTLQLAELPRAKVLGVVNFPSFRAAMESAQHLVKLGPTAVELVDRIMIELALDNPAFRPTMETALIGRPAAILLVEFSGESKAELLPRLRQLVELMGDLGLPGSVVEMTDDAVQKNLWEVRKAGLNIMMSLKGDGKPVSFIEDCAVPLEHLAEYTDGLTEVFARHGTHGTWYAHASVGTLHVRPILDMRQDGPEGGATRMRAIAEEAAELVRKYKGAYSGEHGDGLCRGEWIRWQFGPAIDEAFRAIKRELDPIGLFNPGKIIDTPKMDDVSLLRFAPPSAPGPYRRIAIKPALDWSAWDVQNDPVTEQTTAPGTGGDVTGGFAKAVEMCNNNGHCRKFDAGTMCPSYRVTRDEQHLTRGRANTLRLAVSGQLGPGCIHQRRALRDHGPVRELQGLQARMPHGHRHGKDEDRIPGALQGTSRPHLEGPPHRPAARLRAPRQPHAVVAEPARHAAGCRAPQRKAAGLLGAPHAAEVAARHLLALGRDRRPCEPRRDLGGRGLRREGGGAVRRHLQWQLRKRERPGGRAPAAGCRLHASRAEQAARAPVLRTHLPRLGHGRRGKGARR